MNHYLGVEVCQSYFGRISPSSTCLRSPLCQRKNIGLAINMEEKVLINKINNASYWKVPINLACPLVRDELDKDANNVLAAIIKFQQSLESLMQFYENPLPPLCITVVEFTCWMYVVLGSFALQFCSEISDEWWSDIIFVSLILNFQLSRKSNNQIIISGYTLFFNTKHLLFVCLETYGWGMHVSF